MVALSNAYLERRLSGGSANAAPGASLGGDMSSERVLSQSTTALSNITGVTIDYAGGNPTGVGVLAFDFSDLTLLWTPNGVDPGAAVNVSVSGKYAIFGEQGALLVTVVAGSLAGTDKSDNVTIANIANEEWDNVQKQESFDGDSEYRCFYMANTFVAAVTSITRSGSTAHATTTAAHGLTTGDEATIVGCVQPEYNGTFEVTVIDADEFTYTVTGAPATPATGTPRWGKKFLSVATYIVEQPEPGLISVGVDPAGRGDGSTRSVTSITRSGSVATVTMGAAHNYETGQTVVIAGAAQAAYNGAQVITVTSSTMFTFAVAGAPATPATGTITASRGLAVTVANENTAPVGVTFSEPEDVGTALDLGSLSPGEAIAFWERRVIPNRNTTTNTETLAKLAFPAYF
jgi:hypothetical protein